MIDYQEYEPNKKQYGESIYDMKTSSNKMFFLEK